MADSAAHQRLAALSSHLAPPTAPPPDWPGALAALEATFPAHQLSLDLETRQQHGQSWGSLLPPSPPAAVLHALETSDVVAVVRIATRFGIVLIPTGGRTALEGQFTPTCCSPPVHEQWNGVVPGRRQAASGEVVQPRPTIHVSAPDQTGAGPSQPVEPATPAPSNRVEVVPAAPPHALPARDLPTATPSTSATPTTRPGPDISEFDPFATPMPGSTQGQERARPALQPSPLAQSTPVHTTAARQEAAAQSPSRQTRGGSAGSSDGAAVTLPGATTTDSGLSEPAFNFSGFLKDLRLKSAEPVARYLKRCAGMDPS